MTLLLLSVLTILSSLERRSPRWDSDPEAARDALSAAVSLVLRLLGREHDPGKSREHVLFSVLAERRLAAGETADLRALMDREAGLACKMLWALCRTLAARLRDTNDRFQSLFIMTSTFQ